VGIIFLPFIGNLTGIITGHISLGQIKRTGESGHGMALAGTIIGWVGLGLFIIGIILFILFIVAFAANYPNYRTS
jgi:hypothetical protein